MSDFNVEKVKDVSCFKENALPAKASFIPYGNETEIGEENLALGFLWTVFGSLLMQKTIILR